MYTHMYTYTRIHIHAYTYTHIHMHTYMHVCIYTYTLCISTFLHFSLNLSFDNDFDVVNLDETIDFDKIDINGYSFQHCDYPGDTSKEGELVFITNHLFLAFLKSKLVQEYASFLAYAEICRLKNNNVDDFANIKCDPGLRKNSVTGELNTKNTIGWGDTTDYPGEAISDITGLHWPREIINQPTNFYLVKTPIDF